MSHVGLKVFSVTKPASAESHDLTLPVSGQVIFPDLKRNTELLPKPILHTIDEIAVRLRVSTKTVRRRIKDGTIRTSPIGGRLLRVSSDELRRLVLGPELEP